MRYLSGVALIYEAFHESKNELLTAISGVIALWFATSVGMYMIEGQVQPDKLGWIPDAMWWSVVTLTLVGYGDVVPQTPAGKVFAGVVMLFQIGVIALPAGILAGSFIHCYRERQRNRQDNGDG